MKVETVVPAGDVNIYRPGTILRVIRRTVMDDGDNAYRMTLELRNPLFCEFCGQALTATAEPDKWESWHRDKPCMAVLPDDPR